MKHFHNNSVTVAFASVWLLCGALAGRAGQYMVTTTADSGAGSLRQAIADANLDSGPNVIQFQLSGSPPFSIAPVTALPSLGFSTLIDGTSQSGYAGVPLIEINGNATASGVPGLQFLAASGGVKGLVINRFPGQGVVLAGASNVVQGCYIGTDVTGKLALGNISFGIWVKSSGNQIGGTNAGEGNVISANDTGIYFSNANSNLVQGNLIGTDGQGGSALGNANSGITVDASSGNLIGGPMTAARNVIAGNLHSGIYLNSNAASNNVIQGNYIGLNLSGTSALTNGGDGITVNGAPANTIGGAASGAGNVISGNALAGVALDNTGATGNVLAGNFIGTDATGMLGIGNRNAGVVIAGGSSSQIGGMMAGMGNVISGNVQDGIFLTNTFMNVIQANYIGLSAAGTNAVANGFNGVSLRGATNNLIGGTGAPARNVISGNSYNGIGILNIGDTGNSIAGNYIGTDVTGLKSVPNLQMGVRVQGCSNMIGGTVSGSGNVISGNTVYGIYLTGTNGGATGNLIAGNMIGLGADGSTILPNATAGVVLSSAATNVIGGVTAVSRNVISGNGTLPNVGYVGVYLYGALTAANVIQGNYLGTDATGMLARPNANEGIYVLNAISNVMGGSMTVAGNLIAANNGRGIWLLGAGGNQIKGNWIGLKADGVSGLGNLWHGIDIDTGSTNNFIGGPATGDGNRIAYAQIYNGAGYCGVRVRPGAYNNLVSGNSIFNNSGLGIDLGNAGVNTNTHLEMGVSGTSANRSQNYPVLSNAVSGTVTLIRGSFDSLPNKAYRLEFFASPAADSSGYGEGQLFLGQTNFALGSISPTNFAVTVPGVAPANWVITATATDGTNNTSEFSNAIGAWSVPHLTAGSVASGKLGLTWTNLGGGYVLLQCTNLAASQWVATGFSALTNGVYILPIGTTNPAAYYRLQAL